MIIDYYFDYFITIYMLKHLLIKLVKISYQDCLNFYCNKLI